MTFGQYVGGGASLVAILGFLELGAFWLRGWIVPGWSGSLARLAEAVIGFSLLTLTLQALGTVGLFDQGPVIAACAIVGVGAAALGRHRDPTAGGRPIQAPAVSRIAVTVAVMVALVVIANWSFPTQVKLDIGMYSGDTTWYHGPFAARFAQSGSTTGLDFTDPLRLVVWFYPATSELFHGAGILLFHNDFLSPLINLAWVSLALLAAWCVGRPYGVGASTLLAAALVLSSNELIQTQAGEGRNDVAGIACLLAAVALLVTYGRSGKRAGATVLNGRGPVLLAGLAAGLAIGIKLTLLVPVAVITVGIIFFAARGERRATLGTWIAPMVLTGGYWYLRNLIRAGNPVPWVHGVGPISLPHPQQALLDPKPRFSVSDYFGHTAVIRDHFIPELHRALGPLWPAILALAVLGVLGAFAFGGDRGRRVLAAAAGAGVIVYLYTPLTAAGPLGNPIAFFSNMRYLIPALAVALVLLPIAPPLLGRRARSAVAAVLLVMFAVTVLTTARWHSHGLGVAFMVLALVVAPVGLTLARGRGLPRLVVVGGALTVIIAGVALGWPQQRGYERSRYADVALFLGSAGPETALSWARHVHDSRIGIGGLGDAFFAQYAFNGPDLTNYVAYVGRPIPHGGLRLVESCREWRTRVNAGHFRYLVVTRFESPQGRYPIARWTMTDPAATLVNREAGRAPSQVFVFRLTGRLDPAACSPPAPAG